MRLNRALALGAAMLVLLSACSSGGGSKPTIKIGSDGFYEAKLMAEIYAQVLEANGYTVDRTGHRPRSTQGDRARPRERPDRPQARVHRQRPRLLRQAGKPTGDPTANADRARRTSSTGRAAGSPSSASRPAQDTNAFVVRKDTADQYT